MIKVLIVDDEPFIRQGLKILIDWGKYGYEISAEAANGKEAIRILENQPIDLVVVDIKMPGMDGLELITYVREHISQTVRFIILSGYYEFNYARQAINYKVTDYILKPVEKNELIDNLLKIRREFELKKQEKKVEEIRNRLEYDKNLQDIIYGNYEQKNLDYVKQYICLSQSMRYISFEFDESDADFQKLSVEEKIRIQQTYYKQLLSILSEHPYHIINGVNKSEGYFDIGFIYSRDFALCNKMKDREYINNLYEKIKQIDCYALKVFIGQHVESIEKISDSYRSTAIARSFHNFSDAKQHIAYYDEVAYKKANQFGIGKKLIEELILYVKNNDIERIEKSVDKIYKELRENLIEPKLISANIYYLLYCLIDLAKELDHHTDQQEILQYLGQEAFDKLAAGGSSVHFKKFAVEYSKYLEQLRINASRGGLLLKIEKDITEHYMENLSLKSLGDKYYMNSVYLGQLFKKEYGVAFKDYLNHFRIKKAMQLLVTTDERVYAIASQVGYNNPDYFISKFVQLNGVTPHQYRINNKKT